jgi:hypothetical protein
LQKKKKEREEEKKKKLFFNLKALFLKHNLKHTLRSLLGKKKRRAFKIFAVEISASGDSTIFSLVPHLSPNKTKKPI